MRLPKKASRHESAHLRIKQVTLILQGLHMQAMTNHFKSNAMPCWYFAQGWLWNQLLLWKFSSWLMCWSYKTIIIANGQDLNQISWQSSNIKQLTLLTSCSRVAHAGNVKSCQIQCHAMLVLRSRLIVESTPPMEVLILVNVLKLQNDHHCEWPGSQSNLLTIKQHQATDPTN